MESSVFFDDLVNVVNSETTVNIFVYCKNRCKTAGAYAAASVKRELTVGSAFASANSKLFLKLIVNISGTLYIAGCTKTDRNCVLSLWIE